MQALKDVLGRAEERSNLKSLIWCTALVVGLVTVVFGAREMRFLLQPDGSSPAGDTTEEAALDGTGG